MKKSIFKDVPAYTPNLKPVQTPDMAKTLGKNVKCLRKRARMTKTMFAAMVGIGRPQLNRIENGTADVRLSMVQELAEALEIDAEKLLFGKGDEV